MNHLDHVCDKQEKLNGNPVLITVFYAKIKTTIPNQLQQFKSELNEYNEIGMTTEVKIVGFTKAYPKKWLQIAFISD